MTEKFIRLNYLHPETLEIMGVLVVNLHQLASVRTRVSPTAGEQVLVRVDGAEYLVSVAFDALMSTIGDVSRQPA